MKKPEIIVASLLFIIIVVLAVLLFSSSEKAPREPAPDPIKEEIVDAPQHELIRVTLPQEGALIESPLSLRGEARGTWYFEASFPIFLVNWDGLIIAEGYAQATEDWMTEEFVPFEAVLEFESPYSEGQADFMQRGWIIFKKDNPSGLPEHDDAFEMLINYKAQ